MRLLLVWIFKTMRLNANISFRHFEKEDIDKVADFKFIPNPANGGDDDYIVADMVFKEYTYGESGEEPFCDVNALNRDFGDLRLKELINGKYR